MFAFVSTVTTVSNANIFAHGSHGSHEFLFAALRSRFLNTNLTNLTNILLHTDLTDHTDSCSQRCAHGF